MLLTATFLPAPLYAPEWAGIFAGFDNGITQIEGKAASVRVSVYTAAPVMLFVKSALSDNDGHYLLTGLDPDSRYLIIARDNKQGYLPDVYDHLKPAVMDLADVAAKLKTRP